jgi:hypothetical protein
MKEPDGRGIFANESTAINSRRPPGKIAALETGQQRSLNLAGLGDSFERYP